MELTLLKILIILIAFIFFIIIYYINKKIKQEIDKLSLKLFNRKNKEKQLLDFLYWYIDEIHPADANNLVNEFLNKNNDDE